MRWTGLLLAVACTHAQPPPAPLAVPAENAAGPANLPDAGAPDAGAPDGGTDGGAPRADLVSPITAAGTEVPVELDWADKGASRLIENVQVVGRGLREPIHDGHAVDEGGPRVEPRDVIPEPPRKPADKS